MVSLSGSVVVNIGADYIETFLRKKGLTRTNAEQGQAVEFWVDTLLENGQLNESDFEDFLYEELFYGKRKLMRAYEIEDYDTQDWFTKLHSRYDIENDNYSGILKTGVSNDKKLRIAAVRSDVDYKGNLRWVNILFVHYAEELTSRSLVQTRSYIPVEVDFLNKQVILKAWNRNGLTEDYRPNKLMDLDFSIIKDVFRMKPVSKQLQRKQTLFSMSQGIVDDIYNIIPAYNQIKSIDELISSFERTIIESLKLPNITSGTPKVLNRNAFDLHDEIQKVLEKMAVSDYFYNLPYEEIWKLGVNTIISRIRFNDVEHVLTSLSGEESEMPIFCTKTFMALKKSMEDAKLVERLWVVERRDRSFLRFRYDATNELYLELILLNNARFKREHLQIIMEMYDSYDATTAGKASKQNLRCIS